MQKGTLIKQNSVWCVDYVTRNSCSEVEWHTRTIPLHPEDQKIFKHDELMFDNLEGRAIGQEVLFELVDEFTHPDLFKDIAWGEGTLCAKIFF